MRGDFSRASPAIGNAHCRRWACPPSARPAWQPGLSRTHRKLTQERGGSVGRAFNEIVLPLTATAALPTLSLSPRTSLGFSLLDDARLGFTSSVSRFFSVVCPPSATGRQMSRRHQATAQATVMRRAVPRPALLFARPVLKPPEERTRKWCSVLMSRFKHTAGLPETAERLSP